MVDLYVALVIAKRRVITRVPERYRDAVLQKLNDLGFDGYGDLID